MSDPLIRELDHFVILEPNKNEQILSSKETLQWLCKWIEELEELPDDLKHKNTNIDAAKHLLDTACDLEIKQGFSIRWFAVRLEPKN